MGMGLFTGTTLSGQREMGGQLVVEVPLGRLWGAATSPPMSLGAPPEDTAKPVPVKDGKLRARVAVKPALARAAVRAAWRAHGVADLELLDRMRSRAQTSALLPEARFRMARDWDQSYRLTPTTDDPYRLQETNGGGRSIEGRLTWKLDRLLFVDEELSMERLRLHRVRLRGQLAGQVLTALFDWQRARLAQSDPALDDAQHLEAVVRESEAAAMLDVLTAGWFSAWLERGGT